MALVVTDLLVCFSFFLMHALRLVSFLMFSGLLGEASLICGHVRRPPMCGSVSSNV